MGTRPLRTHYGEEAVAFEVDAGLPHPKGPWAQHRLRLLATLEELDEADWSRPTRCQGWDVLDVVNHLVTADAFWVASLGAARTGQPTRYLASFHPTDTPAQMVATMRDAAPAEVLERFRAGQATFADAIAGLDDADWSRLGEAPPGHVPARAVLAHALWDSWEHERDIGCPAGAPPPVEADELAAITWYVLALGLVEGGLLGDPAPVGPGLPDALDVTIAFDDLPGLPLRLEAGTGVRISIADPDDAVPVGSALAVVEGFSGRAPVPDGLPPALHDQLARAQEIL